MKDGTGCQIGAGGTPLPASHPHGSQLLLRRRNAYQADFQKAASFWRTIGLSHYLRFASPAARSYFLRWRPFNVEKKTATPHTIQKAGNASDSIVDHLGDNENSGEVATITINAIRALIGSANLTHPGGCFTP